MGLQLEPGSREMALGLELAQQALAGAQGSGRRKAERHAEGEDC